MLRTASVNISRNSALVFGGSRVKVFVHVAINTMWGCRREIKPLLASLGPASYTCCQVRDYTMAQQGGAQVVGNQIVGNIGMYYAAYRLSQQGWNVMPTARNARGVDLLVYDVRAHIYKGIQVKALSKRIPVPLGKTLDNLMGDWWIIVTNAGTTNPMCFITKPEEVQQLAHRGEKEGRISYWLQPKHYNTDQFREAWDRIGRGDVAL